MEEINTYLNDVLTKKNSFKIFIAPCSRETAYKNALSTIDNGFEYSRIENTLSNEGKQILSTKNQIFAWGTNQKSLWNNLNIKDIVLFYRKKEFICYGSIIYKQNSSDLSSCLWPPTKDHLWENVFFFDQLHKINIPLSEFIDAAGYSEGFVPQGFMRMKDIHSQNILAKHPYLNTLPPQTLKLSEPVTNMEPTKKNFEKFIPPKIEPIEDLIGIPESFYKQLNAILASGKKHIIFYGPPGTGKTTLAEYVAKKLSPNSAATDDSYMMLTASSSWNSQDLIGGYQPTGPGRIEFIPGPMLRAFDRPLVIDELNRCPIDKVIGPLFSVLSGQSTYLPYRTDVKNPKSNFYRILVNPNLNTHSHEFAPGPHWRFICTLNTIDKAQLRPD